MSIKLENNLNKNIANGLYLKLDASNDPLTGALTINANSTTGLLVEQDGVKDNTLIVDTTNGAVGVNVAPSTVAVFRAATTANAPMSFEQYISTVGIAGYINFRRSLSDAIGTFTATTDTTQLGELGFYGVNSGATGWAQAAYLRVTQSGTAGATYDGGIMDLAILDTSANVTQLRIDGVIRDFILGNGRINSTPLNVLLGATGGTGTNKVGANFTIAGGKATGNAVGGNIAFQTSDAGASGTTAQTLSTKWTINQAGALLSGADGTSAYNITTDGVITADNFISNVAIGTQPYACASTTLNTNLNSDLLDSQHGTYYLDSANFTGTNWVDLTDGGATTLHSHAGGGGAPTDATYITQTTNATLTNEQAIASLATGILFGTTTTGVISSLGPSAIAQGDLLYGSAANTLSALAKDANATRYLSNTGASNNPAWAQVDLTNGVTDILPIANGGTAVSSFSETYGVVYYDGGQLVVTSPIGATGEVLKGNTLMAPTWGQVNLTLDVTGVLPIDNGGTNSSTTLNNQRVMTSVSNAIVESEAITDGESIQRNNTTFISAPLPLNTCEGRLTLTTGTPITTSNVTGATTIYFAPYKGDRIYLYDGTRWKLYSFTEVSLALGTLTSDLPYDVFIYDASGTVTLESAAWTNATTRATALTTQNGVLVKTGSTDRRYLGTFYTASATTTEDSDLKRFLWNYYNRAERYLYAKETTDSWTYGTANWREVNGGSTIGTSRVDYVMGWEEEPIDARVVHHFSADPATSGSTGIGIDSSTTSSAMTMGTGISANHTAETTANYVGYPGIGYHSIRWLEYSNSGTINCFGDGGVPTWYQSGMIVKMRS